MCRHPWAASRAMGSMTPGIDNLLFNCMEVQIGQRLLIVGEKNRSDYYSDTLADSIAEHARAKLLDVEVVDAPFMEDATDFPADIRTAMEGTQHTLFVARIGDQVRFTELPGKCTKTMCYALDEEAFRTEFCSADYRFFLELKRMLDRAFVGEHPVTITCPAGTRLVGTSPPEQSIDDDGDVTVNRFPMTVFKPVSAGCFSGTLALSRWLCVTGSHFYQPDGVLIDGVVLAQVQGGRITDLDGDAKDVDRVRRHYDYVAEKYGIDRDVIHSWHAGFHPQNGYGGLAADNLTRWSGTAFGNPRYLHFHTCGNYAPGEICISVFDPTITVGGTEFWCNGRFVFADRPDVRQLMRRHPGTQQLYEHPVREFGLGED